MKNCIKDILYAAVFSMGVVAVAEASFIHNVGGTDYEWMEFSSTVNMTRVDVEAQLNNSNSALYGYRYANRVETQALLESYTGIHNPVISDWYTRYADGVTSFYNDFGILQSTNIGTIGMSPAYGDNVNFNWNLMINSYFFYGEANECDNSYWTCLGWVEARSLNGVVAGYEVSRITGWDAIPPMANNTSTSVAFHLPAASLLVKDVGAVPVPAAIWLFASGLVGLAGLARRKARS